MVFIPIFGGRKRLCLPTFKAVLMKHTSETHVSSATEEPPLCCCEFIDYRGARSHIMASCCDCEVLDDTCERLMTGGSVPQENCSMLLMIFNDRFRVPCFAGRGAMKVEAGVVLPVLLVPGMIFLAALGPVWTVVSFTVIPIFCLYLYLRCLKNSPRSRFFFVWALASLIFLLSVMEMEVLPYMEIYLYENLLHKTLVAGLLFFVYVTKGDPGLLDSKQSESLLSLDDPEEVNRCTTCNVLQTNRSAHCRLCNSCISQKDHHCIWIDSCIGANNHRAFILALTFLVFSSYYGSLLTLTTICEPMLILDVFLLPRDCGGVYDDIHLAVCFVSAIYGLVIMLVSAYALFHQVYLISINMTLHEWRIAQRNGASKSLRNTRCSARSVCNNWYLFWCNHR